MLAKLVKKYGAGLVRDAIPTRKRKRGRPPGTTRGVSNFMGKEDRARWIDDVADEYRHARCKAPVKRALLDMLEMEFGKDGLAKLDTPKLMRMMKTLKRYASDGRNILAWRREAARAFERTVVPKSA